MAGKKKTREDRTASPDAEGSKPAATTDPFPEAAAAPQRFATRNTIRASISREDFSNLQQSVRPHIKELIARRDELTKSFTKASEVMDLILGIYRGPIKLIDDMQTSWEQETERVERMEYLEDLTRCLERRRSEEAEKNEAENSRLKQQIADERDAKAEIENLCKQAYVVREQEIERKEIKLTKYKAVAEEELKSKEQKWKKDHRESVEKLESENAGLRQELRATKTQLKQARLEEEKNARAYESLRKEVDLRQSSLERMQKQTAIPYQDDAYL
jgi:chromosome segregation ATPase